MDIDIDVQSKLDPKSIFEKIIPASIVENGKLKKHNVGVYFQTIPQDKQTGLSAITYKTAPEYDFFKIDIIHLRLLDYFENKEELREMMYKSPDWDMLMDERIVSNLFHLSNSFDVVKKIKPKSIEQLADCLALIRPNKIKLIDKYIKQKDKTAIRKALYQKDGPSDLRKSHAIPYAYLIIAQLNMIREGIYEIN
jgi:hypothetical protein